MAAGLGTRLRPFTDIAPKPLLPILGIPAIQFPLDVLVAAGAKNIVINAHHHAEQMEKMIPQLDFGKSSYKISDESKLLLGSAGGVRKALDHLGGKPFYLMNSDTIYAPDLKQLAEAHSKFKAKHGIEMTLVVRKDPSSQTAYRELELDTKTGLVTAALEPRTGKIYWSGVGVFEPVVFSHLPYGQPSEFLQEVLRPKIQAEKVAFVFSNEPWEDVGSAALWRDAHFKLMERAELKTLPKKWAERISKLNTQLQPKIWCRKKTEMDSAHCKAPCYYASTESRAREMGPRAVIYGDAWQTGPGISYGGVWVPLA